MGRRRHSQNLQDRIEARKRFHLSPFHVQMARGAWVDPKKLSTLDNHDQERWQASLPQFMVLPYFKRFGGERPAPVVSVEDQVRAQNAKKAARKEARRRTQPGGEPSPSWRSVMCILKASPEG